MESKICLEVGMSDGFDTQRIWDRFNLPIYGFEPVPQMFEHTTNRFKDNPNVHVYHAAVDVEDGENRSFYLSNPEGRFTDGTNRPIHPYGCSSLYQFADDIHDKWKGRPDFNHVEEVKVKTIRIDTFLKDHKFDGEITFMHCDAQGNDVNVLRSMGEYLRCVKEGVVEVAAKTNLYKDNDNTLSAAADVLSSMGMKFKAPSVNGHEADIHFWNPNLG
jgi:FkbM family methyltransferase